MSGEQLHANDPFWSSVIEIASQDPFVVDTMEYLVRTDQADQMVVQDILMEAERRIAKRYGLPGEYCPQVFAIAEERI